MKRMILGAAAVIMSGAIAAPAIACMTVNDQVIIHPVSQEKPKNGEGGIGKIFKIHYSGERSGQQDKLWPNYYVVEVIEGEKKGQKALIPAHVTSCHSIQIEKGATGYVVGNWETKDRDGIVLEVPILATWMNGRKEKFSFER